MRSAEFVKVVMERLGVTSARELAETMRWPRGSERTVARWLSGDTQPSFDYTMEMFEKAGFADMGANPGGKGASLNAKIGAKIRESRLERGLTQQQLADRAKLKRETLSLIEGGKRGVGPEVMGRLAEAMDVSVQDLGVLDEKPRSPWPQIHGRQEELAGELLRLTKLVQRLARRVAALERRVLAEPDQADTAH